MKLKLRNLVFFARHGALAEEAVVGQRFQVDVDVRLMDGLDLASDATEATVNYAEVYAVVESVFVGRRFNLIEACAECIAGQVLERFERIVEVRVEVRKPSVPVDCVCDYFAAEVTRSR